MNRSNKRKKSIDRSLALFIKHKTIQPRQLVNEFLNNCILLVLLLACLMSCNKAMVQPPTKQAQSKPEPLPEMSAKVYDRVSPVIVKIIYDKGKKNGSGVIVGLSQKGRALILTACHVVAMDFEDSDPKIALEFYKDIVVKTNTDVKFVRADVMQNFVDRSNDLALLVTREPVPIDKAIRYTLTDKVNSGEKVAAFGYPKKDELSQTVGRITRLESKYLVFDAKIAPGNSGGPLIDKYGRMIGVSTFIEGQTEGYAVNMSLIVSVVDTWLKGIKLKEKWEYQKHGTGLAKTVNSWPFWTGTGIVLTGGGVLASGILTKNKTPPDEFPQPFGRPPGN